MDWLAGIFALDRVERDGLDILIRTELLPECATLVQNIDSPGQISVDLLAFDGARQGHARSAFSSRLSPGANPDHSQRAVEMKDGHLTATRADGQQIAR